MKSRLTTAGANISEAVAILAKSHKQVILLAAVFLAASCVSDILRRREFRESDYEAYRLAGIASVSGQAFLKTRGGDVRYAAGNIVFLEPATPHSEDTCRALLQNKILQVENPAVRAFQKNTLADAEGRFRFQDLAPGAYFVRTNIVWEVPDPWAGGMKTTGGWVCERVEVKPGEAASLILTSTRLQ